MVVSNPYMIETSRRFDFLCFGGAGGGGGGGDGGGLMIFLI